MYPLWWKSVDDLGKEQMNYFWQFYDLKKILCIIIGILLLIFYIDTLVRLKYERPLYLGKIYAVNTMLGKKNGMIDWTRSKNLKDKIKSLDIQPIEPEWIRDEIGQLAWRYNLQLYRAERIGNYGNLILTYAFIDPHITEEIYAYTVEVSPIGKPTLWDRSIGKLFMSEHKQPTPKWTVVDYYTDSNARNYAEKLKLSLESGEIISRFEKMTKLNEEDGFEEWIRNIKEYDSEMRTKTKDFMKIQNREVKKYIKDHLMEYKQLDPF